MPTKTAAVFTTEKDSAAAGQDLGNQIRAALDERPDAVVVFASGEFDHSALLAARRETCQPGVMVGSSSAGEFTGTKRGEGSACALAVRSTAMKFSAGRGTPRGKAPPPAGAHAQ